MFCAKATRLYCLCDKRASLLFSTKPFPDGFLYILLCFYRFFVCRRRTPAVRRICEKVCVFIGGDAAAFANLQTI